MHNAEPIYLIDCSTLTFEDRLTCAALQGILNRNAARIYLNYGYYDKLSDRTTNEEFISDELWFGKYRQMVGNQDLRNLEYYQSCRDLDVLEIGDYKEIVQEYKSEFSGVVIWDNALPETISVAVMLSALENLLILSPAQKNVAEELGLPVVEDLRGRWKDRIAVYSWALDNLFDHCLPGYVACLEPGWEHPEFFDYVIQNQVFTYSLSVHQENALFKLGQQMLLLLFAGPRKLRNFLFGARLDRAVRLLGRGLMHLTSPETRLATRIQKRVRASRFPTIFGWHTRRDNELAFMLHLSANDLRLVPCHLAGNFSFHGHMPAPDEFRQHHPEHVEFEADKIYLTFTLSDGDQLMMMNTGELGNWYQPERGKVAFNWEVQPLLVELAPALLAKYYATATENDCLVAGPSGAGYTIQPLMGNLKDYLRESMRICRMVDIDVVTSYDGAPADVTVKNMLRHSPDIRGYLGGYVYFGDSVLERNEDGITFVTNHWPPLDKIAADATEVLDGVRAMLDHAEPPQFIGVHLFAYRTSITDIYEFVNTLDSERVKVVRGDVFLSLAQRYLNYKEQT